jgi:hypothetical protein
MFILLDSMIDSILKVSKLNMQKQHMINLLLYTAWRIRSVIIVTGVRLLWNEFTAAPSVFRETHTILGYDKRNRHFQLYQNRQRTGHTICVVAWRKHKNLFPGIISWCQLHVSALDITEEKWLHYDRIRLSYWYLPCDKRLTHRTFVTSSYLCCLFCDVCCFVFIVFVIVHCSCHFVHCSCHYSFATLTEVFFRAFPSVVRQMPGHNSRDGARPALTDFPFYVLFSYLCIMRTVCV